VRLALRLHPERWPKIPNTVFSMLKTREFPNIPPLRIFFTYTDDEVHLRHVEVIQQGGEAEDPVNNAK
jgi:hypothetical protein